MSSLIKRGASPGGTGKASPRRRALTDRQKNFIMIAIIVIVFALPLRGMLRAKGPPMEEGFMLVFAERVLHGDLPNVDFLHLYGPGSLWALAGWLKVFGVNLSAERFFGLAQQMGVVFGIAGLARFWGRSVALPCALISLLIIIPPIGLTALAWVGAVALGLFGLLAILEGRRHVTDVTKAGRWALLGGFLVGWALLFRLDLIVAVSLATTAAAWGMSRAVQKRLALGLGLGVAAYLIHIVTAGPGRVLKGMVLDPVIYLRGGRRLPVPPSWDHVDGYLQRVGGLHQIEWPIPTLETSQQLSVWFFLLLATVLTLVMVGARAVRRDPARFQARVLLAVALFSVGMVPQAMQRVDSAHLGWVSCVPVAFLPVALIELFRGRPARWSPRVRGAALGGGVLIAILLMMPFFTARRYADYVLQSFGKHRVTFLIERNGRTFYYGRRDVADAARDLLVGVEEVAQPGDKLFVGTTDLRKTPYSDAYLYYLLPEYPPGTYFIEMDPGVANREGSRLPEDLADSDIAILSAVWNGWDEPNDARKVGSNAANEVLHRDFCQVDRYGDGLYELWVKCDY